MAGGGAAAAAAAIQALKASGPIVRIEPQDFTLLVHRMDEPVVVAGSSRVFKTTYQYLTVYKGLYFYTKSPKVLHFGARAELVSAKRIWIPG